MKLRNGRLILVITILMSAIAILLFVALLTMLLT